MPGYAIPAVRRPVVELRHFVCQACVNEVMMCHVGTPIRATLVSISVGLVILFTTATIARVAD